jgi:hypothetical protein
MPIFNKFPNRITLKALEIGNIEVGRPSQIIESSFPSLSKIPKPFSFSALHFSLMNNLWTKCSSSGKWVKFSLQGVYQGSNLSSIDNLLSDSDGCSILGSGDFATYIPSRKAIVTVRYDMTRIVKFYEVGSHDIRYFVCHPSGSWGWAMSEDKRHLMMIGLKPFSIDIRLDLQFTSTSFYLDADSLLWLIAKDLPNIYVINPTAKCVYMLELDFVPTWINVTWTGSVLFGNEDVNYVIPKIQSMRNYKFTLATLSKVEMAYGSNQLVALSDGEGRIEVHQLGKLVSSRY